MTRATDGVLACPGGGKVATAACGRGRERLCGGERERKEARQGDATRPSRRVGKRSAEESRPYAHTLHQPAALRPGPAHDLSAARALQGIAGAQADHSILLRKGRLNRRKKPLRNTSGGAFPICIYPSAVSSGAPPPFSAGGCPPSPVASCVWGSCVCPSGAVTGGACSAGGCTAGDVCSGAAGSAGVT